MEITEMPLDREVWRFYSGDSLRNKIVDLAPNVNRIAEFVEQQQLMSRLTYGGTRACWFCSFAEETYPGPSHENRCPLYLGPIVEHKMRERGWNGTFGGLDYYCTCGGWFRLGGMAGHGDGSADAEVRCPNEDCDEIKTEVGYLAEIARRHAVNKGDG